MSNLVFHKCRLCGCMFYSYRKITYCSGCVPKFSDSNYLARRHLSELKTTKKEKERARWHARMQDPKFREAERLRSLMRARAEKKYAKENKACSPSL